MSAARERRCLTATTTSSPASSTTTSPSARSTSTTIRRCCSRSRPRSARAGRSGSARGALSQLPFAQGHLRDGGAARGRDARAPHGELPARAAPARGGAARRPGIDALDRRRRRARADDRRAPRRTAPSPPIEPADARQSPRSCPAAAASAPARGRRARRRRAAALVARDVHAVAGAARARHQRRHGPRAPARARARSSTPRPRVLADRHRVRVPRRRRRSTTRRSRRWAADGIAVRAGRAGGRCDAADAGPTTRRRRAAVAVPRAVALRPRRSRAARRADADDRRSGHQPRPPRRRAGAASSAHVPPAEWRAVQENAQAIERQLRDLREGVMRVRLVPVGEIFRRMPFVVRDLARETGTTVRLELRGQETEIDKFLIERMMDPVLHLVRNAVSHGFEPPAERVAAGKPAEGTLTLQRGQRRRLGRARDRRRRPRHRRGGGRGARARARPARCPTGRSTRRRCSTCSARPGSRRATRPIAPAAAASAWPSCKTTVAGAERDADARDRRPGEGTRFVIELPLTLSITDALIAHGRRPDVRGAAVGGPRGRSRSSRRRCARSRSTRSRRSAAASLPIVRLGRLFGIAERPRRALHVFVVGTGVGRRRPRGRSHRRPARDRRARRWPTR